VSTWILRHGQTDHSVQHLVNGDPARAIDLNRAGQEACRQAASLPHLSGTQTWITSEFLRARQTCRILMGLPLVEPLADQRLNELDYGAFEGGPFLSYGAWLALHGADERPEAATESQREGILRMLTGLRGVLEYPGDRVVVGHGLLMSVLTWGLHRSSETLPLFLPEAPYVEPLLLRDDQLADLIATLLDRIGQVEARSPAATFDGTCPLLEKKDSRYA